MVTRPGEHVRERGGDRALSIFLSVAVHAVIVGALLWGWWEYRSPPRAPQTLAIEATVVRNATQPRVPAPVRAPAPAPAPPPAVPNQAQLAQQRAAEQAAAQAQAERAAQAAAAKAAAEQAAERVAQEKAARAAAAEQQAEEVEAARQAKLAAERKAKQQAEERAKQEAAREAQQLQQQLQAEQAQQAQQQQRVADLQQQLQAEQRQDALEQGPEETDYVNAIEARIERNWVKPASAQPGVKCIVHLTQIPGGEITHVEVESCNGDEAVRQSVETAAYRASPLPAPPDPALFQSNIIVTFAPEQ